MYRIVKVFFFGLGTQVVSILHQGKIARLNLVSVQVLLTCTVAVVHEMKVRSTGRQGVRRRKRNIRKGADYVGNYLLRKS